MSVLMLGPSKQGAGALACHPHWLLWLVDLMMNRQKSKATIDTKTSKAVKDAHQARTYQTKNKNKQKQQPHETKQKTTTADLKAW